MLSLNNLESITKKRKRVGRGGDLGGTSGRGHKGQKARSGVGGELKPWFEGGQMSLTRRLPKRGFTNARFKKEFKIVNLKDLEDRFDSGEIVSAESLAQKGLVSGKGRFLVKVLGNGNLSKNLTIQVDKISKLAKEQVEKAGGKVELLREV
jgi:large subunit ribosomal protein L15